MNFVKQLEKTFEQNNNPQLAVEMAQYMRNMFAFLGLRTPLRRKLLKEIWKLNKQEITVNAREIAQNLFLKEEREYHYCAIDILMKELKNNFQKEDIVFIKNLIITHSWWDSVDLIAKHLLGGYLEKFPEEIENCIGQFSKSDCLWLNRSAILFQLGHKQKTDFELLKKLCLQHQQSSEFFIQKAIGWALREYAKTSPEQVIQFVAVNNLPTLSRKEALKNLAIA